MKNKNSKNSKSVLRNRLTTMIIALFTLGLMNFNANAQCTTGGLYSNYTVACDQTSTPQFAIGCAFAGEYSTFDLIGGITYTFASSVATDYLTIANSAGVPQKFHVSPLSYKPVTTGSYRLYSHLNAACGTAGVCRNLFVTMAPTTTPATPGAIVGNPNDNCAGSTRTFSVPSLSRAFSYNWIAPANANISSGQGTNVITVDFLAGFTGGTLYVSANNCAGTSGNRSMILYNIPATPGSITGVKLGACAGSNQNYSIAAVKGATTYYWYAPTGGTVNSGLNSIAANMTMPNPFTSGTVQVYAGSGCNWNYTPRVLTVKSKPSKPGSITGLAGVCAGSSHVYSVTNTVGVTYTWSGPAGATVTAGQGTNSATIHFAAASGNVSVIGSNGCGSSSARTLPVSIVCRDANQGLTVAEAALSVYPNPASSEITVTFNSDNESTYTLKMVDVMGREVWSEDGMSVEGVNTKVIDLSSISKGVYTLFMTGDNSATPVRFVKE